MVYKSLFDDLFNELFYSFPTEVKPPLAQKIIKDEDSKPRSIVLQSAVAGFRQEDIKIWHEDRQLHIEGDNMSNTGILDKFRTSFSWKIPVSEMVALDRIDVKLEDGLLTLDIPIEEPTKNRKYLFGAASKK